MDSITRDFALGLETGFFGSEDGLDWLDDDPKHYDPLDRWEDGPDDGNTDDSDLGDGDPEDGCALIDEDDAVACD